jgi:phage shock protein B
MDIEGLVAILCALVGLPWLIMHYVTKWKQAPKITTEDEQMLDEMYNLARRLEERVQTVERIVAADNPDWKPGLNAPQATQPLPSPRYTNDRNSNRSM